MKIVLESSDADSRLIVGVLSGLTSFVERALQDGADPDIYCSQGFGVLLGKTASLLDVAIFLNKNTEGQGGRCSSDRSAVEESLHAAKAKTMETLFKETFRVSTPAAFSNQPAL